jgi:hypothetical protein
VQLSERLWLDHKMKRREIARGQPFSETSAQGWIILSRLRRPLRYRHAFIARAIELGAKRATAANSRRPMEWIPDRLRTQQHPGPVRPVRIRRLESIPCAEVANVVAIRVGFLDKLGCDCSKPVSGTNWRATDDASSPMRHEPNHRVALAGKPESNSGVEQLVRRRVPPEFEDEFAGSGAPRGCCPSHYRFGAGFTWNWRHNK